MQKFYTTTYSQSITRRVTYISGETQRHNPGLQAFVRRVLAFVIRDGFARTKLL